MAPVVASALLNILPAARIPRPTRQARAGVSGQSEAYARDLLGDCSESTSPRYFGD